MGSSRSLVEGTLIRDYRLGRCLGAGAMGEVYAARHERTGQRVAIKVLRPDAEEALHGAQRLLEEAQVVSTIRHPGVVAVLDVGLMDERRPWMAMELLEGQTLQARLKAGHMQMEEAFWVLSGVLSTIAAAHRAGVVHRDLKPANIFLVAGQGTTEVKVLDFGVALREGRTSFRTAPSTAVGSMGFMAPEQLMGETVPASDLYAIGCIAYLIFTGRPVFPLTNIPDLARLHLSQPPPKLRLHRPGLPVALEGWIDELLSKNPAERPPSAAAALVELRALMPRAGLVTEVVEAWVPVTEVSREAVATRPSSPALRPVRELEGDDQA